MEINNKIIIYIFVYVLIPIILLVGVRIKKSSYILERNTTDAIKGFLVTYVAIHHYVQKIANPQLLNPLNYVGILSVSFFFLMSGYGLTLSYEKTKNLKGFFEKRFLRLYFPFVIANILTAIINNIFMNAGYSIGEIIKSSITMRTIYSGVILWYVFVQILMYIAFYVSFKFFKNNKAQVVCLLILTFAYIVLARYTEQGDWRYNTVLCFSTGVIIATFRRSIEKILEKYYRFILLVLVVVFGISWYLIIEEVYRNYLTFGCAIVFALLLMVVTYRIKITSPIYEYLGKISYEFYIIQLPVVYLVIDLLENSSVGVVLIVLITIILSTIANILANQFIRKIKIR